MAPLRGVPFPTSIFYMTKDLSLAVPKFLQLSMTALPMQQTCQLRHFQTLALAATMPYNEPTHQTCTLPFDVLFQTGHTSVNLIPSNMPQTRRPHDPQTLGRTCSHENSLLSWPTKCACICLTYPTRLYYASTCGWWRHYVVSLSLRLSST